MTLSWLARRAIFSRHQPTALASSLVTLKESILAVPSSLP